MKALTVQLKPVSGRCDMRCAYCHFADGAGGGRRVPDFGRMSGETLETAVRRALAETEEQCVFEFVGGEPASAGLDFFRRLVDIEDKRNTGGAAVSHTLQTNGLAIDDEWADFLAHYNFVTNLSIDADKKIHDAMRPDAAGKGTHNRAVTAARGLAERKAEFSVMSVLTRALASHPDRTYRYFRDRGFRHAVFLPCLGAPDGEPGRDPHALDTETYGKFLCRMFDLWHHDFIEGEYLSVRMFDAYVHLLAGHESVAGDERPYLVVEADGGVYPDETLVDGRRRLGNIADDSFASLLEAGPRRDWLAGVRARRDQRCGGCAHRNICHGGSRLQRESGGGDLAVEAHCGAYTRFFEYARPRMELLAKALFESGAEN